MPKQAVELKYSTYLRKIKTIVDGLTHIQEAIAAVTVRPDQPSAIDEAALRVRLKEVRRLQESFEALLEKITDSEDSEIDYTQVSKDQIKINDLVTLLLSTIEATLPAEDTPTSLDTSLSNTTSSLSHVRLPRLDLNTFSGKIEEWTSYYSLFDVTVHKNSQLNNVTKFSYLLGSLSGEALKLVSSLTITSPNYLVAIDLLKARYHNPRRLVTLHLSQVIDLPIVSHISPQCMRSFISTFSQNTEALKSLDCDVTTDSNPVLAMLLMRKLDNELRRKLEMYRSRHKHAEHSLPEITDILKFLHEECSLLEDSALTSGVGPSRPPAQHPSLISRPQIKSKFTPSVKQVTLTTSQSRPRSPPVSNPCFVCGQQDHRVYVCPRFQSLNPSERHRLVKQNKRCFSCLGNHTVAQCNSKATCQNCHQRHHTLLHFEHTTPSPTTSTQATTVATHVTATSGTHRSSKSSKPARATTLDKVVSASAFDSPSPPFEKGYTTVLLGTALVQLTSVKGITHTFRALLDSGSMVDFVSERVAGLLGAPRRRVAQTILGISQTSSTTKGVTDLSVAPLHGRPIASRHSFHILDKISADLPRTALSPQVLRMVKPYALADPTFHLPGRIDVLIGAALLPSILTDETHRLGQNQPYVVGTRLGFVVMGQAPCAPATPAPVSHLTTLPSSNDLDLHISLQNFWRQEEPPTCTKKTEEEQLCDEHFASTHSRTPEGRYIVRLPFRQNSPSLGSSRIAAERRLTSLENKFRSQPQFKDLYQAFMDDYLKSGHMTKCSPMDPSIPHYYLPHHGVLKESSSTTKLRTVFDASCKSSNGISLNDVLMTGRKLQNNVCDILLKFRAHPVVFTCDIRQMYRQILVHHDDIHHQLILWRTDQSLSPETYTLNTVTYGVNSSPYLAIKTLQQLALDEGPAYPEAAQILSQHTYVDDIIAGADSIDAALRLQDQLVALLRRGGFELRKWASNAPQLLQALPQDHLETPVFLAESSTPHVSILGLHWSPDTDLFTYHLSLHQHVTTKRQVLSLVAKIYDPCGFLSPLTMWAKCFLQVLWTSGLAWDDPLPPALMEQWTMYMSQLSSLTSLKIPRHLNMSDARNMEIHGFCDASERGYAAVVYLRCHLNDDSVSVRQLISKTRVAPLKKVTLPRLELCGAHLLGQLIQYCLSLFSGHLNPNSVYLWCDSSVALTWLQTPSYRLKTFVANRVAQTQEIVPAQCWRHVSGNYNPADCASRGVFALDLINHSLWWNGPEWLTLPSRQWPTSKFVMTPAEDLEEIKPVTSLTISTAPDWDFLHRFSSWTMTKLVTAYILRFIKNCRSKDKVYGPLLTSELQEAQLRLFQLVQQRSFFSELLLLQRGQPPSTRIQRLAPFLDAEGVLRVGGRLVASQMPSEARHPVLLPQGHHLVDLYIDHVHAAHLHSGPQLTQSLLCRTVWILSARRAVRTRIFKCIRCFRVKPRNKNPLMGDLPPSRVNPSRAFLHTAMDYCGPFTSKIYNLKAIRHLKVYLCLFVCMATKAIHIEVTTDLTTDGFIAALTRFVSRRGLPSDLYSDCGTNFVGAGTALKNIVQSSLLSSEAKNTLNHFGQVKGIAFHFNPPAAPHQGGLWESAVKSAKHHLTRVTGDTILTLQELSTLVVQVEAMLNSRPLTPLSQDPSDISALTPGHFLIGTPLAAVPASNLLDTNLNRLRQWHLVQALTQRFWQRWKTEYLHTLQQRSKWTARVPNLKIGDLVLVHSTSPPLTWPLARITALHPGKDGVVRVVDLQTANGFLTRPVVKVFPLPLEASDD